MKNYIKKYKKEGFCVVKNFIPKKLLKECLSYIKNHKDPGDNELNALTNLPVFQFAKNISKKNSPFMKVLKVDKLTKFNKLLNINNVEFLYPRVYSKPCWYGPAQHYHQEFYYNERYGYKMGKHEYFLMLVALDKHNEDNACMRVIPRSHKMGELEHKQFINKDLFEDSRVKKEIMDKCFKKYGIYNCNLNPGDCIIFHPLTIHGSPTNSSASNRKTFSAGITDIKYIDTYDENNTKRLNYVKKRKDFIINVLTKRLENLKNVKNY